MSLVPTTLNLYVAGAKAPSVQGDDEDYACAVVYDSLRFKQYNMNSIVRSQRHFGDLGLLLFDAICLALYNAPPRYNLVIELEDKQIADRLTENAWAIAKYRALGEEKVFDGDDYHTRIQRLVEVRTKQDDCFVKFVYSGKDPTAQTGFAAARELAQQALIDRA